MFRRFFVYKRFCKQTKNPPKVQSLLTDIFLKKNQRMENKNPKEPLATRKDAARFYAVSVRTIDRMRKKGILKFVRVCGQIRFCWDDLEQIKNQTN